MTEESDQKIVQEVMTAYIIPHFKKNNSKININKLTEDVPESEYDNLEYTLNTLKDNGLISKSGENLYSPTDEWGRYFPEEKTKIPKEELIEHSIFNSFIMARKLEISEISIHSTIDKNPKLYELIKGTGIPEIKATLKGMIKEGRLAEIILGSGDAIDTGSSRRYRISSKKHIPSGLRNDYCELEEILIGYNTLAKKMPASMAQSFRSKINIANPSEYKKMDTEIKNKFDYLAEEFSRANDAIRQLPTELLQEKYAKLWLKEFDNISMKRSLPIGERREEMRAKAEELNESLEEEMQEAIEEQAREKEELEKEEEKKHKLGYRLTHILKKQ